MAEQRTQSVSYTHLEEAQGATSIAQETSVITEMSDDVIKLAKLAKEKSESLLKVVSKFTV